MMWMLRTCAVVISFQAAAEKAAAEKAAAEKEAEKKKQEEEAAAAKAKAVTVICHTWMGVMLNVILSCVRTMLSHPLQHHLIGWHPM